MKLIIPHAYHVKGGVEKVTVSLIREISRIIDGVIFVVPEGQHGYFRKLLPPSDKIIYESFSWHKDKYALPAIFPGALYRNILKRRNKLRRVFPGRLIWAVVKAERNDRLRYLCKKHGATHCLYMITAGQPAPELKIPLAAIIYDLYWRFAPERYSVKFRESRDNNLREWGKKADILFCISKATANTVKEAFPEIKAGAKAVPLACDIPKETGGRGSSREEKDGRDPVLFYPASHNSYQKNFITLFKAAKILVQKGLKFRIMISGRNTEELVGREPSQGSGDETARQYYNENKEILQPHIRIVGFCPDDEIKRIYAECNAVVLPSAYEGFGLPLIESLMNGSPVICSDIEAFSEQVELYDCRDLVRFFPVYDPESLAAKMEDIIRSPKKVIPPDRIAELFSKRTWEDVAGEYVEHLRNTANLKNNYA